MNGLKKWFKIISIVLSAYHTPCMAITLGHATMVHPVYGVRDIIYEKMGQYAIAEGDIILGKAADLPKFSLPPNKAIMLPRIGGGHWTNGIIPFELADNLPLINKLATRQAINIWQQNTHVKFVELTPENRSEYPDYLLFIPTGGTSCSSFVGKQGGAQIVSLASRCNTMSTTHEIGHALGLWHEQSRMDRDAYIIIIWDNIEEKYRYNFNQHLTDGLDFGDYDYQSIMHYTAYAFSKNGEKTIVPLYDNVEIGQRDHLSEKDIAAINSFYPEE